MENEITYLDFEFIVSYYIFDLIKKGTFNTNHIKMLDSIWKYYNQVSKNLMLLLFTLNIFCH